MMFFATRNDGLASRQRILEEVRRDPGLHVSELVERTGLSWHTVAYHLHILVKTHALVVDKEARERRVFPLGLSPQQRSWLAALHRPRASDVLRLLLDDPRQGVASLSRRMGFSEKIVRRQITHLSQAGLVERRGEARPVYRAHPDAEAQLEDWLRRRDPPASDLTERGPLE